MIISIASDHAGFQYKQFIKKYLEEKGFTVLDHGTFSSDAVDYPDFIKLAAKDVSAHKADFGIGICGTGIGVSIVANKFKGVRAALVLDEDMAELSRRHNNANFLALGQRISDTEKIIKILDVWLNTGFDGGRHERRVNKIED
ncbi:MAG: ribose 5-phosphate isomerase B [Ignavibacteriaceae bacterium]|nr:ribose 5-phosphate isomerase B [Ignavibacteriaceae bacterium]